MIISQNNEIPLRLAQAKFTDTTNPLIRLQFVDISKTAESPNEYVRISADANGSGGSKLIIFLNIGEDSTDYTQYQFSAYATGVADPAAIDASPTHTQCTTLKALLNALNAIDGIVAHRLDAPADYSLDTDDFKDVSSTALGPLWLSTLYRDVSEILTFGVRFGIPENINGKIGRGRLEIVKIDAYANGASATDVEFKLSQDPNETDETEESEVLKRYVPDSAITELYDYHEAPLVVKGPVLVELTATSSLEADTAWCNILYRNAEH